MDYNKSPDTFFYLLLLEVSQTFIDSMGYNEAINRGLIL